MIDSHTHIGGFKISSPDILGWMDVSENYLLEYIEKFGLDKVWLLSHPNTVEGYVLNNNDITLKVGKHPSVIPFCYPETAEDISGLVERGCKGIGEIKVEGPLDSEYLLDIFDVAGDFGLPVVIHTTDKHCYGGLEEMVEVFSKNPKTSFIMHGWNWWNRIKDMREILNTFDNVFMDISANSGILTLKKYISHGFTRDFLENFSNRVLFGTDFPMLSTYDGTQFGINSHHWGLVMGLTVNARNNIFEYNALRLIK